MFRIVLAVSFLMLFDHSFADSEDASGTITVGNVPFLVFENHAPDGEPFNYYIRQSETKKPLLVYIQGSGCEPPFIKVSDSDHASTVFSLITSANDSRFVTMIIEKPHSPKWVTESRGLATNCPNEFNESYDFQFWRESLLIALDHAMGLSWVDEKVFLIGLSEGAVMASAIASSRGDEIDGLALFGATGHSQAFDFFLKEYIAHSSDVNELEKSLKSMEKEIRTVVDPTTSEQEFAWGHTVKRWRSFFEVSIIELLQHTDVPVLLISGMEDRQVPIVSSELLYASLLVQNSEAEIVRVPGAGHDLIAPGETLLAVDGYFSMVRDWFLARGTQDFDHEE